MKKLLLIILLFSLSGCSNTVDLTAASDITATALASKYNQASEVKSKYRLINTALKMTAKADPKDTIKVTVGSDEVLLGGAGEFEPSVKISRWDEVSLKMTPKGLDKIASKDKKLSFEGNKIKFETPKVDYKMYDLPASKEHEEGAYEIEAVLKEKPITNVVEFSIETQGLDFFYNKGLDEEAREPEEVSCTQTQCFDKDGKVINNRPENVVDSYAVYYANNKSGDYSSREGGKNYKAGKFGHIYRPLVTDANGNKTWGQLNVDVKTGILRILIDQDWLNKAAYPVVVDPTLGYTTVGATQTSGLAKDTIRSWNNTITEAGAVYAVLYYSKAWDSSTTGKARGTIYLSSNLSRITYGSEVTWTDSNIWSWKFLPVTRTTLTASTAYRVGMWIGSSGTNGPFYAYDSGATMYRDNYTYHATNAPVDPCVDDASTADRKASVYALYSGISAGTYTDTFEGSGTWTAPTGVTSVNVACWGGGAGGSGSDSTNKNGGGGGAYSASTGISVIPGNDYTVVVGSGGASAGTGTGGNGGDSSFDSTTVVAKGGLANGTGGAAASGTGDTRYNGGNGVATSAGGGGGGAGTGGAGGNASGSTGGTGTATGGGNGSNGSAANTTNGLTYGGGAGGSSGGTAGYGANGACTITYTISAPSVQSTNKQQIIIFD